MTATATEPTFPATLRLDSTIKADILSAYNDEAIPGEWPEDLTRVTNEQLDRIGWALITQYHPELLNRTVRFIFKEKLGGRGDKIILGKARKASAELEFFTGIDFVIEISWSHYKELDLAKRVAILDHELEHCTLNDKDQPVIHPHDLEEFNTIVRRHGAWKADIDVFLTSAKEQQTEMNL